MSSIPVFDISNPLGKLFDQAAGDPFSYEEVIKTATPGAIVTFNTNIEKAINSLKANIDLDYDGVTSITITANGTDITIDFKDENDDPVTVYEGVIDITTGVVNINRNVKELGSQSYSTTTTPSVFYCNLQDKKPGYDYGFECNNEDYTYYNRYFPSMPDMSFASNSTYPYLYVKNTSCETTDEIKAALNGVKVAYELETPIVLELDPTIINTILGDNTFSADTGNITELKYIYLEEHFNA